MVNNRRRGQRRSRESSYQRGKASYRIRKFPVIVVHPLQIPRRSAYTTTSTMTFFPRESGSSRSASGNVFLGYTRPRECGSIDQIAERGSCGNVAMPSAALRGTEERQIQAQAKTACDTLGNAESSALRVWMGRERRNLEIDIGCIVSRCIVCATT